MVPSWKDSSWTLCTLLFTFYWLEIIYVPIHSCSGHWVHDHLFLVPLVQELQIRNYKSLTKDKGEHRYLGRKLADSTMSSPQQHPNPLWTFITLTVLCPLPRLCSLSLSLSLSVSHKHTHTHPVPVHRGWDLRGLSSTPCGNSEHIPHTAASC
jgi:hypothetical protein